METGTAADRPTAVFVPSGRRGAVAAGMTVLDAARILGVDLEWVGGGRGICGHCQVQPVFGRFAKHAITATAESLSAPGPTEAAYHGRRPLEGSCRLGCAARILGDVVIDVPPESQVHRPVVRKSVDLPDLVVDPVVQLHYVEVEANRLGEARSDLRLLLDALATQWSLTGLETGPHVLDALQPALQQGGRSVTVAVHGGREVMAVWPGFAEDAYGVAVDVGSTTIAGHLCHLGTGEVVASAGVMNPQIRFGEDLMSRVSYVMMNPGGQHELTVAVRTAVDDLVGQLTTAAGVPRTEVLDLVAVGNPIMHHLLLGIDPTPLGTAPFTLATDLPVDARAADLGVVGCPCARVHLLPCIAGHVGADTAAMILAEGPHRGREVQLLVDIGTNAEVVLGNDQWLLAASSPTGPAFKGAQISCGQRATAGAVERVRIDRETLEPRLKAIGSDRWSDDSGFGEDLVFGITGVCGSGIIEAVAELYLAGVIDADGVIDGGCAARTPRVVADGRVFAYVLHRADEPGGANELRVTQGDVRAIQLAKAALHAGARLLMDHAGLDAVQRIRLAGAFGAHIDPIHALVVGLIPDCPPERVIAVGNAAGAGAVRALLSASARGEIADVARSVTKVETAVEPRFQDHFVAALAFPHATEPYDHLARAVALPQRRATASRRRPRRSRAEAAR